MTPRNARFALLPNDPPDVDRGVVLDGPFVEDAKQSAVVAGGACASFGAGCIYSTGGG